MTEIPCARGTSQHFDGASLLIAWYVWKCAHPSWHFIPVKQNLIFHNLRMESLLSWYAKCPSVVLLIIIILHLSSIAIHFSLSFYATVYRCHLINCTIFIYTNTSIVKWNQGEFFYFDMLLAKLSVFFDRYKIVFYNSTTIPNIFTWLQCSQWFLNNLGT